MRFVASLTHQRVVINGLSYPDESKNKFPKLRGGTADSTLKFLLKLMDLVENGGVDPDADMVGNREANDEGDEQDEDDVKIDNLANNVKLRQIANVNNGDNSNKMEVDDDIPTLTMKPPPPTMSGKIRTRSSRHSSANKMQTN